jgi:YVTN family beta-propeller protein
LNRREQIQAPTNRGKSRGRPSRRVAIGAAVGALVAIAVVVFLVARANREDANANHRRAGIAGNSVVRLDPATGEVTQVFTGLAPTAFPVELAIGEGGLWIRDRIVRHIDLDTGDVIGDRDIEPSRFTNSIAVGAHRIWTCGHPNRLVALNPSDEAPVGGLDPELIDRLDPDWTCGSIAASDRWIWAAGTTGGLLRVDPTSFDSTHRDDVVGSPGGIAIGFGRVWVGDKFTETVKVFDAHLRQVGKVPLGGASPEAIVTAGDYVWVLNRESRIVQVINPTTLKALQSVPIQDDPAGLAAGPDGVWVAGQSGTVTKIDLETREPSAPFQVARAVGAIVVDPETGYVYLTTTASGNVNPF